MAPRAASGCGQLGLRGYQARVDRAHLAQCLSIRRLAGWFHGGCLCITLLDVVESIAERKSSTRLERA